MLTLNKRWLISLAIWVLFGTMAAGVLIVNDMQAYQWPSMLIYFIGFLAGSIAEITKRI